MDNSLSPCSHCGQKMLMEKVPAWNGHRMVTHFFLLCEQCGHGPTQAFENALEALQAWNKSVIKENSPN